MITFEGISSNSRASGVFIEEKNVQRSFGNLVAPQVILILGQYNSGKTPTDNIPVRIYNKEEAWDKYGRGSLLARLSEKVFLGNQGQTEVWTCPIAENAAGVKTTAEVDISGTASAVGVLSITVGDRIISIAVASGATATATATALAAAINADLDCMFTATSSTGDVTLTCRHKGLFGNDYQVFLNPRSTDATPAGLTISVTQSANGTTNPLIATALGNMGDKFYTVIVSPYDDATNLGSLNTVGIARIAPSVKRPFISFVGINKNKADYITALGSLNSQFICTIPTFVTLYTPSFELAAEIAGNFARIQLATPNRPVKEIAISGVSCKQNFVNFTYSEKNDIVLAGGSTFKISPENQLIIGDLVTTRTTNASGGLEEDWRFAETISNLQTKIYSLDQLFNGSKYLQAIVVDDDSITNLSYVVRPKSVKQDIIKLIDELWMPLALSKQRDNIVENLVTEINSENPTRIDCFIPDILAAGLRIVAVRYEWSYSGGNN